MTNLLQMTLEKQWYRIMYIPQLIPKYLSTDVLYQNQMRHFWKENLLAAHIRQGKHERERLLQA